MSSSLAVAAATSAGGNLPAAVAVVGGLGVLAGITTLSPLAVDVAGRVPLSGAGRLALRGIARQRTRSAAVVTAIATVMTIAVAVATIVGDLDDRSPDGSVPSLPADRVMVWPIDVEPTSAATAFRPSDELLGSLAEALPDVSSSSWPVPSYERGPGHDQMYANASFLVADDDVLDAIGLSDADRRALQEHGAVAMYAVDGRLVTDGTVTYQVPTAAGTVEIEAAVRQDPPRSWGGSVEVLLAPAQVAELGWDVVDGPLVLRTPTPLTETERDAVDDISMLSYGGDVFVEPRPAPATTTVAIEVQRPVDTWSVTAIAAVITGAALLLTLAIVAVGLSLAAAEGRDERDVLVALGARPRALRRVAAIRALVMTGTAAVLAAPTGYIPVRVAYRAADDDVPAVPWAVALILLVAVPVVAAVAAGLVGAAARRLRPPTMATLVFE